ncbi:MAG: hypothetical protein K8J08_16960 [Thermoanaerobaculia bacterium]|nr:hypothetical protein [Thermoanaerobaculia bacterium]
MPITEEGTVPNRDVYESHRIKGIEARDQGLLHEALEHLEAALQVAHQIQDHELIQKAICNRSAVAISLGETLESTTVLRRILMENGSLEVCFLAAYNLARCHELIKEPKKSLFYARIARDRATDLNRSEWNYGALNQIANALAAESHFCEAADRYRDALSLLPPGDPVTNLEARINLGYCLVMQGLQEPGLATLYRGLKDARRYSRPRLEMIARIDLAYATLEAGRPDLALRHVRRGLALAERAGDSDAIKNALYIEGEVWSDLAREDEAQQVRTDLQRRFYPNQPEIARYLMAINSRELINLRA